MKAARDLHIRGIVQGVGFRPFVYRQATRWGLTGWVLNAGDGVHAHIEGDMASLEGFMGELEKRAPAAARITSLEVREGQLEDGGGGDERERGDGDGGGSSEDGRGGERGGQGFVIRGSDGQDAVSTLVSPDIATCPACLRELLDPRDRRFHYPFINCTDCGPRFTIIDALPYDRPNTSMAPFALCAACGAEYHDPLDRRFHAQPDACFDCGPSLRLWRRAEECGEQDVYEERDDGRDGDEERDDGRDGDEGLSGGRDDRRSGDDRLRGNGERGAAGRGSAQGGPNPLVAGGRAESDALIAQVAELLNAGGIVAIKGLGGYYLACDATNEEAVALLRRRKRRSAKPFALMVRDLAGARALCQVTDREAALLSGTVRPIVLLRRRPRHASAPAPRIPLPPTTPQATPLSSASPQEAPVPLAPSVAGDLHELGVMLPSTPVQHLLMTLVDVPLVMTSGNISEEPIIAREAEAHELLGGVADAFLDNDREILSRYDDSVVRVIDERTYLVRRARGYAPEPLPFPRTAPAGAAGAAGAGRQPHILAVGPEQKNTFCLARDEEAFCSQHLGDLESASAFEAWLATLRLYRRVFALDYRLLACDTHPEYLSTKWARAQDEARVEVQHHHAHIASILAEHRSHRGRDGSSGADAIEGATVRGGWGEGAQDTGTAGGGAGEGGGGTTNSGVGGGTTGAIRPIERVIGIAFDGTGYGDDGTLWGGEVLIAGLEDFERFAHLRPVPLPGGKAAIIHPDRMAWSYLRVFGLTGHRGADGLLAAIGSDRLLLLEQIVAGRVNTPLTSSMGRLFDAASALAGVCAEGSYEGQAAVEFEAALYDPTTGQPTHDPAADEAAARYRFSLAKGHRLGRHVSSSGPQASATAAEAAAETGAVAGTHANGERAAVAGAHANGERTAVAGARDTHGTRAQGELAAAPTAPAPAAPLIIDPAPVLAALLDDCAAQVPAALISLRFHNAVVALIAEVCDRARARTGLSTVALGGGVFMNRYLLSRSIPLLESEGFTVLTNRLLPANDGCVSYGQAAVAAARATRPTPLITPTSAIPTQADFDR